MLQGAVASSDMHATSLRIPTDLYREAQRVLRRRGVSFNAFVEQAIRAQIAAEEYCEMYEAATLLGQDPDSDVEFALDAQAEVALGE